MQIYSVSDYCSFHSDYSDIISETKHSALAAALKLKLKLKLKPSPSVIVISH